MTAQEAYESITDGGATGFARVIELCERFGPYCLIGGLAVNCYVDPVYTLDADIVLVAQKLDQLVDTLPAEGFRVEAYEHPVNAFGTGASFASNSLATTGIRASWRGPAEGKSWARWSRSPHWKMSFKASCGHIAIPNAA